MTPLICRPRPARAHAHASRYRYPAARSRLPPSGQTDDRVEAATGERVRVVRYSVLSEL